MGSRYVLSGAPERANLSRTRSRSPEDFALFLYRGFFRFTSSRETWLARVLLMRTRGNVARV